LHSVNLISPPHAPKSGSPSLGMTHKFKRKVERGPTAVLWQPSSLICLTSYIGFWEDGGEGVTSNLKSPLAAFLSGTSCKDPDIPPGRPCKLPSSSKNAKLSSHWSSTPAWPSSTEKWRGGSLEVRCGGLPLSGGGSGLGICPLLYHSGISTWSVPGWSNTILFTLSLSVPPL
jgi:hypothetical protein